MKTTKLILFTSALFLLTSCQKESDLTTELSDADDIANEGMEEALHEAEEHYEDLIACDDSNNCTVSEIHVIDSLFHHHSDLYDFHHTNYSHNNLDDDHHHSAVSNHHHGTVDHGEEEGEEHHGHSIEGHTEMFELRGNHENYHPN